MDVINSTGESSSKGREDGDDTTGSDRPLKKARFAWQVKGKYHLKNETDGSSKNIKSASVEPPTRETLSASQGPTSMLESNIENYFAQQDYSELDGDSSPVNSTLFSPISSFSTEQLHYPRYMSSNERTCVMPRARSCYSVQAMSTVKTENQCIAQWQSKQILNSILDNTLNKVMESWTIIDSEPQVVARDFAEFINHLPGDNSVENEGILMAISAHGLQNTSSNSSNETSNVDNGSLSSLQDFASPLRCLSPTVSDNEPQNNEAEQCETENKPTESNKLPDWQTDSQNASDSTSFAYFSYPPQSPYFCHDNIENTITNTDSLEIDSNFDFMNEAVLFAIKSKGLTASGTEYG